MKNILIVGKNSYLGKNIEAWLGKFQEKYCTSTISVRDNSWESLDYSGYDTVLYIAGIAHIKETKENSALYYRVNCDLAYNVAKKVKKAGVKHFIFFSSMSVYGMEIGNINQDTPLSPNSHYGKSKLQAEKLLSKLEDVFFKIAIIRPPMIYGKGCKGNYVKLSNLVLKTPIFPDITNRRSMIYIDNLCMYVQLIIDNNDKGIFLPQNGEYVCTTEMARLIAQAHNKKVKTTKLFNPIISNIKIDTINKVFGSLVYDKSISKYEGYNPIPLEESILFTES